MAHQHQHRCNWTTLSLLLAISVVSAALLFVFTTGTNNVSLQNDDPEQNLHRQLLFSSDITPFADPKSVSLRNAVASDATTTQQSPPQRRNNCQIVYVIGVEGSIHHGLEPIIDKLAKEQVDPATGIPYNVVYKHPALRAAIFGSEEGNAQGIPIDDPLLVQSTLNQICPSPINGMNPDQKHVVLESASFPSNNPHNESKNLRVRRQKDWVDLKMTPEEIASSEEAMNHPTNLHRFQAAFGPYVDIKYIVLNRPYLDTIASHPGWDHGPTNHSTVISGFMVLLSGFLMGHLYDDDVPSPSAIVADDAAAAWRRGAMPLWTIVCADRLSQNDYETEELLLMARGNVLTYLANFLAWPQHSCPGCFDLWFDSNKGPAEERLGEKVTNILLRHMEALEGTWPPRRVEDNLPEQQCRM